LKVSRTLPDISEFQKLLGVSFSDLSLLEQALTHSSYVNEKPGAVQGSNERLEFLGDAVLGLVITERIYHDFPHLNEGEMTKLRAALVCRECLARLAKTISLGDYLYLGKGEESSGGRRKPANLACAFEALIAAVFLDQGPDRTQDFILKLFLPELKKLVGPSAVVDYKSRLQEVIQAKRQATPTYHLIETSGPEHAKQFIVEVRAGNKVLVTGTGGSKKAAEAEAARLALERLEPVSI
jgi:ribonuclease III